MHSLPTDWQSDRLKDSTLINSISLSVNTDPDYEFDYLEISNVDYRGIVDEAAIERLRFEDTPSRARRYLFKNNTAISSVRPNLQAVVFVSDERDDFVCSTGFNVVEPLAHKLWPKFVYYVLISESARQFFDATAKGVGYPAIDDKDFCSFSIPFSSVEEQQRIATYLDASCAAIDAAVAAKRKQHDILEELYKFNLHTAFQNPDWPNSRIKEIAVRITSGVTPEGGSSGYLDEGIPLLRSQNIHFDGLRLDDVALISEQTHAQMPGSQLKPKDVLVNITGASIGRCTFVPEGFLQGNVNQHVCIVRPNHKVDYKFLAYFLASPFGQSQIFSSFTGSSRQGLSHTDLGLIQLPLPSIQEQRFVVEKVETAQQYFQILSSLLIQQIDTLTAYRKSLIHECVTGQRRISEADLAGLQPVV